MSYDAQSLTRRDIRSRKQTAIRVRSGECAPVRTGVTTVPRNRIRRALRTLVSTVVRFVFFEIAGIILGLWLQGGGLTGIHDASTLLTSIGRLTGLYAAYLLLIQVLLMARLPFLEFIAGFDRLALWHRLNGKLCLYLIVAHVASITAGYALTDRLSFSREFLTLLARYPGMLAATAGSVLLVLVAVTSAMIVRRRLRYELWLLVHLMAYLGIFLAWFHQIPSGHEFLTHPLAAAFWTVLYVVTLQFVLLFRFAQPFVRGLWHHLTVASVIVEGPDVVSLYITGRHLDWLNVSAGQFFLWRFLDRERWHESHPFSLSAAPDGQSLRITVKTLGDFTGRMAQIKPGTRVLVEGPFGSFTREARTGHGMVLIAAGIGITPNRALLEDLDGDVVLIYRARREEDLIFRHELEDLARKRGTILHYVVGDRWARGNERFLSAAHLRRLAPHIAGCDVFLCGPQALVQMIERNVQAAGVAPQSIHIDRFAF